MKQLIYGKYIIWWTKKNDTFNQWRNKYMYVCVWNVCVCVLSWNLKDTKKTTQNFISLKKKTEYFPSSVQTHF